MPSFDYVGSATKQYNSPTGWYGLHGPGGGAALSSGGYDPGSGLGDAYQAQSFNLNNADRLGKLTDLVNTMNRSAQKSALDARVPNNPALETKSSANIGSELGGQLPDDVMRLLGQQAAERGVATGGVGSPNANAAYLRALGLSSLQLQEQGQRDLSAADARNPQAPIFDPSSQLLTPYQGVLLSEANAANNLQANQLIARNNLAQQEMQLDRLRYANPTQGYGPTGTGNTGTGSDLFPSPFDTTTVNSGGTGGSGFTYSIPSDAFQNPNTFYDYTPPSNMPVDFGSPGYADTPVSMYG